LIKESTKLNNNAHQKLSTTNPGTTALAIRIIIALITNRNNPSVKTVKGIVSIISNGFTVTFSNESNTAIMIAVINSSTTTPGSKYDAISTPMEESNILTRIFIFLLL
jgi:hypothetical protein